MRAKLKAILRGWSDTDEKILKFGPTSSDEERLLEVIADSYTKHQSGDIKLLPDMTPVSLTFGNVAVPRALWIRVEGIDGADMVINGAAPRQLRPFSDVADASLETPVAIYVETCNDLVTVVLNHPGPSYKDPVQVQYIVLGDPA